MTLLLCICSVDARDRSFQEAERWSDENVFGNRAYFRPNSRPAILAIENVQETDAAVYRCRVDFRVAQTRNAKVNLTVISKCVMVLPPHITLPHMTARAYYNVIRIGVRALRISKLSGFFPPLKLIVHPFQSHISSQPPSSILMFYGVSPSSQWFLKYNQHVCSVSWIWTERERERAQLWQVISPWNSTRSTKHSCGTSSLYPVDPTTHYYGISKYVFFQKKS